MKKFIGALSLTVLLAGCGVEHSVSEVPKDSASRFNGVDANINIVTDSKTGCKYIYIDNGIADQRTIAITPLMKNFTQVDCGQ